MFRDKVAAQAVAGSVLIFFVGAGLRKTVRTLIEQLWLVEGQGKPGLCGWHRSFQHVTLLLLLLSVVASQPVVP